MSEILASANAVAGPPEGGLGGLLLFMIAVLIVFAVLKSAMDAARAQTPPPDFQPVDPDAGALLPPAAGPLATGPRSIDIDVDIDEVDVVIAPPSDRSPFRGRN